MGKIEIDETIQNINETIGDKPELSSDLLQIRRKLETMKVAILELKILREDFERGNITNENYRIHSKRLRTDLERTRNEIELTNIISRIKEEERSKFTRLKNTIKSNADLINLILNILKLLTQ